MSSIQVTFYTDPLCCWSWAMMPSVQKIKELYGSSVAWRYRMGGLIPSWKNFNDPVNSVTRPFQMGPVWMHAAAVSGSTINHTIWHKNPPSSSYPACIAFKAAALQSAADSELYLQMMREACMLKGVDISKARELIQLAHQLRDQLPGFDVKQFVSDFTSGKATGLFKEDIREIKSAQINRFPTLVFRAVGSDPLVATGYRSYEALLAIIKTICPGIREINQPSAAGVKDSENELLSEGHASSGIAQ